MKKSTAFVGALFLSTLLTAPPAFPWGWTVHAYIDEQFATKWHIANANQLYGGLAPDLFNFRFDAPAFREYMQGRTHNDFMAVWNVARSQPAKALAFGFVSHNELWGIDSTAHRAGITFGQQTGYVIAKAYALMAILNQVPAFSALQLPEPVVLTVAHELVERGVDLLMKKLDPMIGLKMAVAALPPNPNFPLLMEKAYAADLATYFGISRIVKGGQRNASASTTKLTSWITETVMTSREKEPAAVFHSSRQWAIQGAANAIIGGSESAMILAQSSGM